VEETDDQSGTEEAFLSHDKTTRPLLDRARAVMPGGVNSPVRAFHAVGGNPRLVARAEGPYIFDTEGNRYIDLVGSWGPAIVGHAHPVVVEAVQRAASDGLSFGATCAAEIDLAEMISAAIPSVEMVRLVSSGTEAAMSAIRLARCATGRPKVLKFLGCYHGHSDGLLVAAGSGVATFDSNASIPAAEPARRHTGVANSAGVPDEVAGLTLVAPYNDLAEVERILSVEGGQVAAIIVEPIAGNMGMVLPEPGFLEGLRSLCDHCGSLLIFDEVMTGFRVTWGGYQNDCGVTPDLTCLGKVIGGGMPVAAYGGPRDLMRHIAPLGPVYQAGTLSGNPLGMAAGIATLRLCREQGFYDALGRTSLALANGLQQAGNAAGVPIQIAAKCGMFCMSFSRLPIRNFTQVQACDHEAYARFFHAMLDRGVWLPPSSYEAMFVSAAHDCAIVERIVHAGRDALAE
jgi:glutamate-1-semialdehyde 2,1-aminomutase